MGWQAAQAAHRINCDERQGPRREKVRLLIRDGRSAKEIAAIIGVTERTVERDKRALGLPRTIAPEFTWTAKAYWLARNLVENGCPVNEIARTIGSSRHAVTWRFRAELDARPPVEMLGGHDHERAVEMGLRRGDGVTSAHGW